MHNIKVTLNGNLLQTKVAWAVRVLPGISILR